MTPAKNSALLLMTFQVRLLDSVNFLSLTDRVSKVLDCVFVPSEEKIYTGMNAVEAETLGIKVILTENLKKEATENTSFWLTGVSPDDISTTGKEMLDISPGILTVLHERDSTEWYIPTLEEKYREAGLDWPETE